MFQFVLLWAKWTSNNKINNSCGSFSVNVLSDRRFDSNSAQFFHIYAGIDCTLLHTLFNLKSSDTNSQFSPLDLLLRVTWWFSEIEGGNEQTNESRPSIQMQIRTSSILPHLESSSWVVCVCLIGQGKEVFLQVAIAFDDCMYCVWCAGCGVSDGTVRPTGRCSFCLITEEFVRMGMKGAPRSDWPVETWDLGKNLLIACNPLS
jgi:hypothetical protein